MNLWFGFESLYIHNPLSVSLLMTFTNPSFGHTCLDLTREEWLSPRSPWRKETLLLSDRVDILFSNLFSVRNNKSITHGNLFRVKEVSLKTLWFHSFKRPFKKFTSFFITCLDSVTTILLWSIFTWNKINHSYGYKCLLRHI